MPIGSLRAIIGHSSITTSAIYLRSDSAQASVDPHARLSLARTACAVVPVPSPLASTAIAAPLG